MVYFVCAACGTSLKKNQVTTHWFKCRSDRHVSCMDCGKDFWGEDYNSHIKCISEEQKYEASTFVPKENKGEKKQEEWVTKIKAKVSSTKNMDPQVKNLLQRIIHNSNIPRKEAKFRNFMKNSFRIHDTQLIDKVWLIFKDVNTKNESGSDISNGMKNGTSSADTSHNDTSEEAPTTTTVKGKDDAQPVKMNKRERKELRREKQNKKSKKEKHGEHADKGKMGTKRKLDCIEEEEHPTAETEEPVKQKKRKKRDDAMDQVEEAVGMKKKKKKGDISYEECQKVPPTQVRKSIGNGNIEPNLNHELPAWEESPGKPQRPGVFKWNVAIKKVLKKAPDEGLKVSKLQRKVFSLYYSSCGEAANEKSRDELAAILTHKLSKKNNFIVQKGRARLRK